MTELKQTTMTLGTKHRTKINIIYQRKITAGPKFRETILEAIDDKPEAKKGPSIFSKIVAALTKKDSSESEEEQEIQYEVNSFDEVASFFARTAQIAFGNGDFTSNEVVDFLLTKDDAQSPYDTTDGSMVMFKYEPTTKNKIKYYDTIPLIINTGTTGDSLVGLNLHYLPPKIRLVFLKKIMGEIDFDNINEDDIMFQLSSVDMAKFIRPMYKQYKYTGISSRLINIPIQNWLLATLLPISNFKKKSKQEVWDISKKMITDEERRI